MVETPRPLAVVTGASEGIGVDLAYCYARAGYDVVLVARRRDRLERVAEQVRSLGVEVCVVAADLAQASECARVVDAVASDRGRLRAWVNNAGIGTHGWFHELPLERQQSLLDVNVSALTVLCRLVLPWMRTNGAGHIMNVASVASFQPGPLMATYYASKAYVLSLSLALHNECAGTGVTVSAVCPGPTRTGFQAAAGISPKAKAGGAPAMDSPTVARLAFEGARRGDPVVFTGFRNRVAGMLGRYLPYAWTAAAVRRIQLARLRAGER